MSQTSVSGMVTKTSYMMAPYSLCEEYENRMAKVVSGSRELATLFQEDSGPQKEDAKGPTTV